MLSDYEKLRQEQLAFLKEWNLRYIIPARKNKHDSFSIHYGKIYALRLDDLVDFANKNKMTFEYSQFMEHIIFRDIRRDLL